MTRVTHMFYAIETTDDGNDPHGQC